MTKIRTKGVEAISIQALADDAAVNQLSPKMRELAGRIDDLRGDRDGRVSADEVNAFVSTHLNVLTEAYAKKKLMPEATALLARAIAIQVRAQEADENAALAAAIDGRATTKSGARIGDGDGTLSRSEVTAFIKDRQARLKREPENREELQLHIALAERVLKRMRRGASAIWGKGD